ARERRSRTAHRGRAHRERRRRAPSRGSSPAGGGSSRGSIRRSVAARSAAHRAFGIPSARRSPRSPTRAWRAHRNSRPRPAQTRTRVMSAGREAVLLLAVSGVLYLTGAGSIPFYTRGEPREGLVVQEMLRTGAWLVPARPDGEPARKPPLYYCSAAVALRALPRQPELALRLPSALFATAGGLATAAPARLAQGPAAGLPAALVLATAFEWTRAATSARVDMTLAATLTFVLAAWTIALARGSRWPLGLAAAGALLGTLAKGPVALVLPGLAAAPFVFTDRDAWRRMRAFAVLALAAGLAALWYWTAFRRAG